METTYTLPQSKFFSPTVQQEQPLEKSLGSRLREMSNIIINHQTKIRVIKCVKFTLETNSDIIDFFPDFILARDTFYDKERTLCDFYSNNKHYFIKIILKLAETLREYGVITDNSDIIEQSKLTADQLYKFNEKELVIKGLSIFNNAKIYFQSLTQIGNLHNILLEIKDGTSIFNESFNDNNNNLSEVYNKLHDDLKEFLYKTIDKLANELKEQYPRFYIEYKSARLAGSLSSLNKNSNLAWII